MKRPASTAAGTAESTATGAVATGAVATGPTAARLSDWERKILPLREQTAVVNGWLEHRLATILPEIMRREGFDMWIVCAREYNEDPVLMSLLPAPMLSARRRTILVFSLQDGFEALNVAPPGVGLDRYYRGVWNKDREEREREDQWACLRRIVAERDPQTIGVNVSETFAFGDGLSHSEHARLMAALGPALAARCQSAERLAVGWLERRSEGELHAAAGINEIAHGVISEAFSSRVVHPGVTTALDVAWWMRQRIQDLGLCAWFQPTVSVQRRGADLGDIGQSQDEVILPGDLLHCDVGLHYLGLATDTQRLAYVLKLGEEDAPEGLGHALERGNRLQDILAAEFRAGRTGNDILARALAAARRENIGARIYSHPIGYHGHGAGPTIGLYDNQEGVPGRGDYELYDDTLHSFELYVKEAVPEWDGQEVKIALEQIIAFSGGRVYFLAGRQTAFYLIG